MSALSDTLHRERSKGGGNLRGKLITLRTLQIHGIFCRKHISKFCALTLKLFFSLLSVLNSIKYYYFFLFHFYIHFLTVL